MACPLAKPVGRQAAQVLLPIELVCQLLGLGLNVAMMSKAAISLGDVHGANLPGPLVNIAEKFFMNGFQVGQVEIARYGVASQLARAQGESGSFSFF